MTEIAKFDLTGIRAHDPWITAEHVVPLRYFKPHSHQYVGMILYIALFKLTFTQKFDILEQCSQSVTEKWNIAEYSRIICNKTLSSENLVLC